MMPAMAGLAAGACMYVWQAARLGRCTDFSWATPYDGLLGQQPCTIIPYWLPPARLVMQAMQSLAC